MAHDDDTAARLGVDPGRPPRLPDPDTVGEPEPARDDAPPAAAGAGELPGWTPESAGRLFMLAGTIANALAGLRLPDDPVIDDVFIPTDHEVRLFGEAASSYANRHPFLVQHSGKGDVAVMGSVLVEYGMREVGRLRVYKRMQADAQPVDVIDGLGVRVQQ